MRMDIDTILSNIAELAPDWHAAGTLGGEVILAIHESTSGTWAAWAQIFSRDWMRQEHPASLASQHAALLFCCWSWR